MSSMWFPINPADLPSDLMSSRSNYYGPLLAIIALSAVQSSAQTFIHDAILFIDTSNNTWYNQVHWRIRAVYLSIIASNKKIRHQPYFYTVEQNSHQVNKVTTEDTEESVNCPTNVPHFFVKATHCSHKIRLGHSVDWWEEISMYFFKSFLEANENWNGYIYIYVHKIKPYVSLS